MTPNNILPSEGDICLANLDPTPGSAQADIRPIIIVSSQLMNLRSKRLIICPITSNMQPWTTKIALPSELKTRGMVLTDQIRSIDQKERVLRFIESTPPDLLTLVRSYIGRLLDLEISGKSI